MIFQDKSTLFSKLFKVFYTGLYIYKNTLKTSLNVNINLMLNIKHKQTVLAVNLQCAAALYRNSIPEWWQQQQLMTKLCESDWRSDTRLLNYTMFYSYHSVAR